MIKLRKQIYFDFMIKFLDTNENVLNSIKGKMTALFSSYGEGHDVIAPFKIGDFTAIISC